MNIPYIIYVRLKECQVDSENERLGLSSSIYLQLTEVLSIQINGWSTLEPDKISHMEPMRPVDGWTNATVPGALLTYSVISVQQLLQDGSFPDCCLATHHNFTAFSHFEPTTRGHETPHCLWSHLAYAPPARTTAAPTRDSRKQPRAPLIVSLALDSLWQQFVV